MYKYLKKFKFNEETCIFNTREKDNSGRQKKFNKQRKKYGFDERETWSLDFTSATWLYSHLKMYLKVNIVNLTFHKFDIPILIEREEEELEYIEDSNYAKAYFKEVNKELSQKSAIKLCITYLKDYLMFDSLDYKDTKISIIEEAKAIEKLKQAFKIYSIIIPAMWW